jgi:hypothetical protein
MKNRQIGEMYMPWYKWLSFVPYVWLVLLIPAVNSYHRLVFGMPLLLLWTMLGVVVTTLVLFISYTAEYKTWSEEGAQDEQ